MSDGYDLWRLGEPGTKIPAPLGKVIAGMVEDMGVEAFDAMFVPEPASRFGTEDRRSFGTRGGSFSVSLGTVPPEAAEIITGGSYARVESSAVTVQGPEFWTTLYGAHLVEHDVRGEHVSFRFSTEPPEQYRARLARELRARQAAVWAGRDRIRARRRRSKQAKRRGKR